MTSLSLAGREVGPGRPCLVIAEAGVNHDGDEALAHRLVEVAAAAGADAVKFQTFAPELLASAAAPTAPYQAGATGVDRQRGLLGGLVLPPGAWAELADHARERGLLFLSTPFDPPSADLLCGLGVPALKVPSGELTNLAFLADLAGRGLPLLLSTGMATGEEVAAALAATSAAPGRCVLHCVSAYPAPAADANLRVIPALAARFGLPVGWSDHTVGTTTALGAVALGAALLEKHVTVDRGRSGPDHAASADPAGLADYVRAVRELEAALGDGEKRPMPSEAANRVAVRRSLHAARPLRAGQALTGDDVVALRPATGLPPATPLAGLRLAAAMAAGEPITAADVRGPGAPR
jgi:N-acetylneuraminate synthase/N,N'-diacetyllegionaminate synthase